MSEWAAMARNPSGGLGSEGGGGVVPGGYQQNGVLYVPPITCPVVSTATAPAVTWVLSQSSSDCRVGRGDGVGVAAYEEHSS